MSKQAVKTDDETATITTAAILKAIKDRIKELTDEEMRQLGQAHFFEYERRHGPQGI